MTIVERLDLTLARMAAQNMAVRAIYLDPADRAAFRRATRRTTRDRIGAADHAGHEIRDGRRSMIYSAQGVGRMVARPRRSRRT